MANNNQIRDPKLASIEDIDDLPKEMVAKIWIDVMKGDGLVNKEPDTPYLTPQLISKYLEVNSVEPGHACFTFTVRPAITNRYNTLHGGAVGMLAVMVGSITVKTVAGNKDFSVSELTISYLSPARLNAKLKIECKVLKHGKSIATVSIEVSDKATDQAVYHGRLTYFSMLPSSL